jgi:hypothetical protein
VDVWDDNTRFLIGCTINCSQQSMDNWLAAATDRPWA